MEDEDGVEAPHPSHPAKELWPYWPGGLQDQWDIDLTDSTKECDTGAAAASPELLSSCVERCHAEVLQRLDKQDEVLRRIHITLLKQPTARALNTDINCKLPEMHDSGEFGQLDITNSLILGEEKVKVCTPEVFHTFTEADLVLRERAAEVDGDLSRQLYASAASTQGTLDRTRKERLQLWFRNLVNSPAFDMFFAFVVLTNSVFLGIEVELGMHTDEQPFALEVVQLIYAGLFTAELAMRVGAFGLGYFCGSDWMWAWLDFGIVLISLVEIFVDFLDKVRTGGEVDSNAVGSFTGFKALRLIRITRLLKTLRVVRIFRFVMALRTLVTSIVYTLRSLFWALTLLLLIVYVFSVLITQAVDPYLRENPLVSLPDEELEMARAHLNSLTQTMLSLFMSISGGLNWVDLAGPLQAISTFWVFVLLFYVSFTYFAVLNVVTGVFCQSAIDSAQNDHANIVHAMLANKEAHIDKIRSLFSQLGADKTGVITYAMFEEGINSPATCEYFESLGLDVWDAWSFFKLLDLDKGGAVEIEEFFKGCLRLRGQARGVDVGKILHDQTWLIKNTGHFQAYMEVKMKQLTEMMSQFTGLSVDNSWSRQISA